MFVPVIDSFLDTDLYKFTMQAAIHKNFPHASVEYLLTNRTYDRKLNGEAVDWLRQQIMSLGELRFAKDEVTYLRTAVPQLSEEFLSILGEFRLDPATEVQVLYDSVSQDLTVTAKGLWHVAILYEIPLLALVSEAYFRFVDKDWDLTSQDKRAHDKATELFRAGCSFAEFGTRRRRSRKVQDIVLGAIVEAAADFKRQHGKDAPLLGTSNVLLARKYALKPIGTIAHEFPMGVAAFYNDFAHANRTAVKLWLEFYGKQAGFALTDTFGSSDFFKVYDGPTSTTYFGVRQDSGNPAKYTKMLSRKLADIEVDGTRPNRNILYSDSLDIELCKQYKAVAEEEGLVPWFGVGTFFTNDFFKKSEPSSKSVALNIVMKLSSVNGNPCVKLSDSADKNMGPPEVVARAKSEVNWVDINSAVS